MANTAGMAVSFKAEVLTGIHAFGPGTGVPARTAATADVLKAALILASGSASAASTTYASVSASEVSATGYTAGGVTVTQATAPAVNSTAGCFTPSASFSWTFSSATGSFDCCFIYNSSQGNKAISVHTFAAQSIGSGTFTLTMPANTIGNALIQIS